MTAERVGAQYLVTAHGSQQILCQNYTARRAGKTSRGKFRQRLVRSPTQKVPKAVCVTSLKTGSVELYSSPDGQNLPREILRASCVLADASGAEGGECLTSLTTGLLLMYCTPSGQNSPREILRASCALADAQGAEGGV